MKTLFPVVLAAALVSSLFAVACAGETSPEATGGEPTSSPAATTATTAASPGTNATTVSTTALTTTSTTSAGLASDGGFPNGPYTTTFGADPMVGGLCV